MFIKGKERLTAKILSTQAKSITMTIHYILRKETILNGTLYISVYQIYDLIRVEVIKEISDTANQLGTKNIV